MNKICFFLIGLLILGCGANTTTGQSSGGAECEGPDIPMSCFFPAKHELGHAVWLAAETEPGTPMSISGRLLNKKRQPLAGYVLYLYQTDATGHYTKKGDETGPQKWHGHLHGWLETDAEGRFELHSIRPAPYPRGGIPAHIHCAVQPPNGEPFYINDFVFADDPLITNSYLKGLEYPGGDGVVDLKKNENGEWIGERLVVLKGEK